MIHKTAEIGWQVQVGEGVEVGPYAVITGDTIIEDHAYIGPHAVIGSPAQSVGVYPSPLTGKRAQVGVRIGRGACVREFATVHQGLLRETIVGENSLVMAYCHVSHDSTLGEGVTLSTGATLGGFSTIGDDANLGQHAVTHPWIVVGSASMIGLNSSVLRDVEPYTTVAGAPARLLGANRTKVSRDGTPTALRALYDFGRICCERDELKRKWYSTKEKS
jgi:UDP-N-acetylglucosamine acyltransferase